MKRVFITGATGFIGYHLLRYLRDQKVEIWVLCRKECKDLEALANINGIHIVECDLDNILDVPNLCKERKFDVFYHLAWKGASGIQRNNYDIQMKNAEWTCNCVEVAKKLECKKIIITGTVCEKQYNAIKENKKYVSSAYYLYAKNYARDMARILSKEFDVPLIWCQFYHPIGVYNKKNQLIAGTIYKILNQKELQFGDGQGLFDVIDVSDLTRALYIMGQMELKNDTYFVGSGKPKKLIEYLEITRKIINPSANMQYGTYKTVNLPMNAEWLDVSPLQIETGFSPEYSFEDSVYRMVEWMKDEELYNAKKWEF